MSELRHRVRASGREILQDDIDTTIGDTAGFAVSRMIHELYRLPNGAKGILPASEGIATIAPATGLLGLPPGDTGAIYVNPFRACIGSTIAADPGGSLENYRGVRSSVFIGASSQNRQTIFFVSPPGSDPYIALVYAAVIPNDQVATRNRYFKDISTGIVSNILLSTADDDTVTVLSVNGAPSPTPIAPSLPVDGGGVYYIPLAYVRVNSQFHSTIRKQDIQEIAPVLTPDAASGAASMRVATANYDVLNLPNGRAPGFAAALDLRDNTFLPRTMSGCESIQCAIDLGGASGGWSITSGQAIDSSRDWRNRIFRITATAAVMTDNAGVVDFAWQATSTDVSTTFTCPPHGTQGNVFGSNFALYMGQSFNNDTTSSVGGPIIAWIEHSSLGKVAAGNIYLWVNASTGALHCTVTGSPNCKLFLWIDASAQFANRA